MQRVMRWAAGAVLAVALVLGLSGEASTGLGLAGLTLLVAGLGGLVLGRARWAGIRSRQTAGVVAALGTVGFVAGGLVQEPADVTVAEPPAVTAEAERAVEAASAGTALAALVELEVKGRAPKTGYEREAFGQAWADVDRNGCDTRNDILRRDLDELTVRPGTGGCVAASGVLAEPFSGQRREFVRGEDSASAIHIDHVVALSDAWQKGAQQWDAATREAFANDPINLLAVDGRLNSAKGDADTATWLPPNRAFRCAYVARQVSVKHVYDLWVTAPEREAMARVLSNCPDEPLVTADDPPRVERDVVADPRPERKPDPEPEPEPDPEPKRKRGTDPRFGTCGAAISADYGPYVRGVDEEYEWYRDADRDGVVCER